jgi:hypothetical protein
MEWFDMAGSFPSRKGKGLPAFLISEQGFRISNLGIWIMDLWPSLHTLEPERLVPFS